ncbi:NAD-dependent epimerase/dehydratase family protein [Nonomuraea roseoviolacea]|uniref:UDP-glucuronate decarboxylase n=1 Tax=Nonomuraea roseoviolacea subsp. carminata TaxID=160689 RepID=A0ABT1K591_9ACTN|nr:GDP-mannose 4,6-dehydratase [Nonomuraea roseoviolacea]MCP2349173.1 UDP-glucose 4-epimerase [Nonomuraea roseoviolacea subsp. carminata]
MTNASSRTYLITGGSGFVGSHLTDALLARGDQVLVLDNLSTGRAANLRPHPNLRFVQGSILDELVVDELVRRCDVVVHLAAAVGVRLIVEEPLRSLTTNIRGSEIVIQAAHRYRKKILVASTSEIYGKNSSGPLREDADRILGNTGIVRWAYSTAKAVDEIVANAYHHERGLETIVVRLFNTVGPRQSPAYGMVIPRFVQQALAGLPLTVHGDGTQTRCFAHVADVVDALLRLLGSPEAVGQTFNIGSAQEVSILELAKLVIEHTGSTSGVDLVPYDEAYRKGFEDMTRRVPDTTKIRELTGWVPRRTLDEILTEVVKQAREELAAALQ